MNNKRSFLTLLFISIAVVSMAQQTFKYQATLQVVPRDGFYSISLKPAVVGRFGDNMADIRIFSQDKQFVPYVWGSWPAFKDQLVFIPFPQLKTSGKADTLSTLIVENQGQVSLKELYLLLRNTAVQRSVNLSGSDNQENWFAIKENVVLEEAGSDPGNSGTYQQVLTFPPTTYRYLKIQVNNKNKTPVAILQAGIYRRQFSKPTFTKLTGTTFVQKDSSGTSYINVKLQERNQVNTLHLELGGQKYFKRNLRVYQEQNLVLDTMISSSEVSDLNFSVKAKNFRLEIVNGDNPALRLKSVDAFQLNLALISYLEAGKKYKLLFGDPKAMAPDYDLKFFGDSLQQQISQINHGAVKPNTSYHKKQAVAPKAGIPSWVIWMAIAAVLAILALLTYKMTREINQRKE